MRILLVGSRILPFRHGGDKNFWLDIIRGLPLLGHEVEVLSSTVEDVPSQGLPLRRVPPIPMFLGADSRYNSEYRHIAATNNYTSKTITLPRIVRELRRRRKEFRPDVIHFIDNYGPAMVLLGVALGNAPLTVSAPTYQADSRLYDFFLRASFAAFHVIIPFSEAYRDRLLQLGIPPDRVQCIRWGVDTDRFRPPSTAERDSARERLGLGREQLVVLWTGFTQQTDETDLRDALRTAELALRDGHSKAAFLFCFKAEHFKETYHSFERPGLRVFSAAESFQDARVAADILLAPIHDTKSTAAPPLVWLECLAMGIPIITGDIPGTREAVLDGRSGFVVQSPEAGSECLRGIETNRELMERLRGGARGIALERYSVPRALQEYLSLWATVRERPRRQKGPPPAQATL